MRQNKRDILGPSKRKVEPKKRKSKWKKILSWKRLKLGLSRKNNFVNLLITEAIKQASWGNLSFLLIQRTIECITNFTMFYRMRKTNLTNFTFQAMLKICWMTQFRGRKVQSLRTGENNNVKVWANLWFSNPSKFKVRSSGFYLGALSIPLSEVTKAKTTST